MYRRSLVDTGESELSNPDVTDTTTEDVQSQNEAAVLADEYLPFIDAGYASASDPNSTQPTLDKFIEGWTYQQALSTKENAVFYHDSDSDVVISAQGTTGPSDAAKTWNEVASEGQSLLGSVAATFFPGVANATTGAANAWNTFSTTTQSFEERVDSMHAVIDLVRQERGADANVLLIGHSLGGHITRTTAQETGLSSIIYNAAVGKNHIYRKNTAKNVEVRIRNDVVSTTLFQKPREFTLQRGAFKNPISAHRTEQFALDPEFHTRVLNGEVKLQSRGKVKSEQQPFERHTNRRKLNVSVQRDFVDTTCGKGYRHNGKRCVSY